MSPVPPFGECCDGCGDGEPGPIGPQGPAGPAGADGADGATGPAGADGADGATGPAGADGADGADGTTVGYAEFYALMPGDNAATVAIGGDVDFPQDGPTDGVTAIRAGADTFTLANIGVYSVEFQVSVAEAGQLVVVQNGVEVARTVVGRATGTSQIVGSTLIQTTAINEVISIRNPAGSAAALTITPFAGGSSPVSANLVIQQIA